MKNIWKFLGLTQERIGRRRFLIAFLSAQWGLPLAVLLVVGLFYLVFGEDSPILFLPVIVFFASLIFGFIVYIKICIRRVRDIGIAQNWWILAIVPLINIPFFLYLVLKKGKTVGDDNTANTNKTKEGLSKSFYVKVAIIAGVLVLVAISLGAIGIMQPKEDHASVSNTLSDAKEVSSVEELSNLLFGDDSDEDSAISFRELFPDVLTRMDDLRYIEDIEYFETQKKLVFRLNSSILEDEHIESFFSSLASSVLGDISENLDGKLSVFMDNNPRTGDVYGWNFYRIYQEVRDEDCAGVGEEHLYYSVCELYWNRDIPIPVHAVFPIIETTPIDSRDLHILQIYIGNKLVANFVSGSVFNELSRLNLIGDAFDGENIQKIPELKLK